MKFSQGFRFTWCHFRERKSGAGFTLIELLVVIGVVATLATAVILVLNPAELLAGARDSTRLSDLAALNSALTFFQADQYNQSMGTSSTVYVSVPDSSPTCANLGLPALPGGWSYSCSNSTNYQKVDGTGWLSINFNLLSSGSPLSRIPIDPVNTTTTGNYYTYTPGGSWHITAYLEAAKNKMGGGSDKASTDTGSYPDLYEVGTNLTLLPVSRDSSLVGYWKFDEGTGGTTYDVSGHGKTGTLTNGPSWLTSSSCGASNCLSFDGVNDYVTFESVGSSVFTRMAWVYPLTTTACTGDGRCTWMNPYLELSAGSLQYYSNYFTSGGWVTGGSITLNAWQQVAVTFNGSQVTLYVNGQQVQSAPRTVTGFGYTNYIGANGATPTDRNFSGRIDNVRIYNRVLSAAEIQAIYNATQ